MTNPDQGNGGAALTVPEKQLPAPVRETNTAAAAAREKAAIEARALVAMHRPRDFNTARLRILAACQRPRFAETAKYSKPVGGREKLTTGEWVDKRVDGLSIRFAEEMRTLWGNLDVSAFIVFDDADRRVVRVVGVDLETNASDGVDVMIEKTVERRKPREGDTVIGQRVNSRGEVVYLIEANEDALLVKQNNMIAKARRNVILTLIPADIKEEADETIEATIANRDAKDPEGEKKRVLDGFYSVGVMPAQVEEFLGHSLATLNPAELHMLRRVFVGLRDGEATWADVMENRGKEPKPEAETKKGTAGLKEKLEKKQGSSKDKGTGQGAQDASQGGTGSPAAAGNAGEAGSLQLTPEGEESEEDIRRQERELVEREAREEKNRERGS